MNFPLLRYVGWRLAILVPQLFLITAAVFFIIRLLPADPAARLVGSFATPGAVAQARHSLGLDQSLLGQFGSFLKGLGHANLGVSWVTSNSVTHEVLQRFPVTFQLIAISFGLSLLIAIPLGLISAIRTGGRLDKTIFGYSLFAGAQPDFWWGLIFLFIFVYKLGWFPVPTGLPPVGSRITGFSLVDTLLHGDFAGFWATLRYYALPCFTLAFVLTGPLIKMIRQNMTTVLESDFILHARASGLDSLHLARNALLPAIAPVLTLTGILFGFMLGGAVLVETIFSIDGLAHYAVDRTLQLDYPAIQGVVLVMTAFSLLVYLTMDITYALIDPRVRAATTRKATSIWPFRLRGKETGSLAAIVPPALAEVAEPGPAVVALGSDTEPPLPLA